MFNKEKNSESRGFNFIDFISQILFALILTFVMLLLAPSDVSFMEKILRSPLVLLLNFIPILFTGILFQGIFGRRSFALVLNSIFYLILFTVHRTKVIYRNAPFRISDLALSFEALKMSQNSYRPDFTSIIIFAGSLIILIFLSRIFKSEKLKASHRLIAILSIVLSSVLLYNFVYSRDRIYNNL